MTNTQTYYVRHEVSEEIYIERSGFIFEGLASCYEQINERPDEFKLVEVERDKLMAWQMDVSLETVLGMPHQQRPHGWGIQIPMIPEMVCSRGESLTSHESNETLQRNRYRCCKATTICHSFVASHDDALSKF